MNLRSAIFGINTYLAGIAALFIAFQFELPNPWWALLTVFFTSQPGHEGGIRAKAVFRLGGTLIGLTAALIFLPNLVNEPEILIATMSTWLGACLFVSLLDRTPRSYMAASAGFTLILVGFPIIDDPGNIFDTAIARTEEILIGVTCTSIAHGVIFPRRIHDIIVGKVDTCLADAATWSVSSLSAQSDARRSRLRYAIAVIDLAIYASVLPYEAPYARNQVRVVQALIERLARLLPLLDAIEERYALLGSDEKSAQDIVQINHAIEAWITSKEVTNGAYRMATSACDAAMLDVDPASWRSLNHVGLLSRQASFAKVWYECRLLALALRNPHLRRHPETDEITAGSRQYRLHNDPLLALWSGAAAAVAVLAVGYLSILIKWDPGTLVIGITAVFSSLFASLDDPTPVLRKSVEWTIWSIPIGFIYVFGILPAVDGFIELAICLLPVIFISAYWMAQPKTMIRGTIVGVTTTSTMALQSAYVGNLESFANLAIASTLGITAALVSIRSVRMVGVATIAKRVVRHGWRDLAYLAAFGRRKYSPYAMRMMDRVNLLVPRTAPTSEAAFNELRDLRLGVNLSELMDAFTALQGEHQNILRTFRTRLARHIRWRSKGRRDPKSTILRDSELDALCHAAVKLSTPQERRRAITALTGLRNGLVLTDPSFRGST